MSKILSFLFCGLLLMYSCGKPEITDDLLDGPIVFDPSLYSPEEYLQSARTPIPSTVDLNKHVILAIHGYSATTFEWQEFADWSDTSVYHISQVLLDGHGRDYDSFKASTWQDWSSAIKTEYEALIGLGYTKISLVGSSTGGTLIMELISSGYFESTIAPTNIFLIDPIVVPTSKLQTVAGILGPMLVFVESDLTKEEQNYWYRFRPEETVRELNKLMKIVRKDLEKGVSLPKGTYFKGFHSAHDPVASTTSTVLIRKGLFQSNGDKVDVEIMESKIHVFTRLGLRDGVTDLEKQNQLKAFSEMADKLQ